MLYYLRDYRKALGVAERVLKVAKDEETYVGSCERREIETLIERCNKRLDVLHPGSTTCVEKKF